MFYAFSTGLTTVVAAGPSIAGFVNFYQAAVIATAPEFESSRATDMIDHLGDPMFEGFHHSVYVFTHADEAQQQGFITANQLSLQGRNYCVARHAEMMAERADPYAESERRTLGEICGLDQDDPWDHRSAEEKALDETYRQKAKEAKERGDLSGESFNPIQVKKTTEVHITDVRAHTDSDGNVEIDDVIAVKGLYDDGDGAEIDHEAGARQEAEKAAARLAAFKIPRPWHDGTTASLSAAEMAELPKAYEPTEFIFCIEYVKFTTEVTITPRTYFQVHGKPWDGALNIEHLLPEDIKLIDDGFYHTTSRNGNQTTEELTRRGFVYSLMLQLYLNNQ